MYSSVLSAQNHRKSVEPIHTTPVCESVGSNAVTLEPLTASSSPIPFDGERPESDTTSLRKHRTLALTTTRRLIFQPFIILLLFSSGIAGAADVTNRKAQQFFASHCIRCHGPERLEGDVRVDQLSWDLDDLDSVDLIQNILDEIVVDSMPPADQPRPSAQELKSITEVLGRHLAAAKAKHVAGGGKPVRRLTRTEYVNTLYDLLGVRVDVKELPEDSNVGSFDTEAITLFTTDMHIEQCLNVARDAARRFIASRGLVPGRKQLKSISVPKNKKKSFSYNVPDIPPAGFLTTRTVCWKTKGLQDAIYHGPAKLDERYEITGTVRAPQHIDRNFYESRKESWPIKPGVTIGEIQVFSVINPQPYQFFEKFRKRYGNSTPDAAAADLILDFVTLMNRGRKVDRVFVRELVAIFNLGRRQGESFWEAVVQPMALAMCTMESMFHFETRGTVNDTRYVSPIEMVNRVSYFLWRSAPDAELIRLAQSKKWMDPATRGQQYRRMVEDEKFERFLSDFATQWLELDRQDEIAVDLRVHPKFNNDAKNSMKEETIQFLSHVIRENLPLRNVIDSDFMLVNNVMAAHYGLPRVHGDDFRVMPVPDGSKRGGILTHAGILMQTGTGERTSIVERGAFVARKLLNDPPPPPPPLVDELPSSGKIAATMTGAQLVAMHRKAPQCASCHNKIDSIGTGLEELDAVGLFRTVETRLNPNLSSLRKSQRKNPKNHVIRLPIQNTGRVLGKRFSGVEQLKQELLSKDVALAEAYLKALLSMANGRKSGVADQAIIQNIITPAKKAEYPALWLLVALLKSDAFKTH